MKRTELNWITGYIWGIADDVLRDLYVRGKYRLAGPDAGGEHRVDSQRCLFPGQICREGILMATRCWFEVLS